jgi:hypothetical protein
MRPPAAVFFYSPDRAGMHGSHEAHGDHGCQPGSLRPGLPPGSEGH